MNYQDLKEQTASLSDNKRKDYRKLMSLACVGGDVKAQLKKHLEAANTLDEFYEAVYVDDAWAFDCSCAALPWRARPCSSSFP